MNKIILIDSGHGGMINNVYQTAPEKMHKFSDSEIAYEGVINREIKKRLIAILKYDGIKYIDVCPTELDLSLSMRVNIINMYCEKYGAGNCLLISLHCNAGGGTGFEIWTSPEETESDKYATKFIEEFEVSFPTIRTRKDTTDGDPDKESAFYILVKTKCPAILPEWLFFDNYQDFKHQRDPSKQLAYAKMISNFIKNI